METKPMHEQPSEDDKTVASDNEQTKESRRPILRKLGRFAAITPPAVILLLAARTKPTNASPLSPSPL